MSERGDPIEFAGALTVFRASELERRAVGPRTICICGSARGGTSAVALFTRELGVFMGKAGVRNQEDVALRKSLDSPAELAERVRAYDAQANVWAFKAPQATDRLLQLEEVLRNPVFVFVSRNPLAVVQSMITRENQLEPELDTYAHLMARVVKTFHVWNVALHQLQAPVIGVDYEKMLAEPAGFADAFVRLLGITVADDRHARALASISSPGYKTWSGHVAARRARPARS